MDILKLHFCIGYFLSVIDNIFDSIFMIEYHLCFYLCFSFCCTIVFYEYLGIEVTIGISFELGRREAQIYQKIFYHPYILFVVICR